MPRFFFDTREDDRFTEDEMGLDLPNISEVRIHAAAGLVDLARELLPGSGGRLCITVRDQDARSVMEALMVVEIKMLALEGNT